VYHKFNDELSLAWVVVVLFLLVVLLTKLKLFKPFVVDDDTTNWCNGEVDPMPTYDVPDVSKLPPDNVSVLLV
jgi:hypothetical protein